jgi:hypothetical protein
MELYWVFLYENFVFCHYLLVILCIKRNGMGDNTLNS